MATISQADANILDHGPADGDPDQDATDRLRTRINDRVLFKDGTNAASAETVNVMDDDSAASNGTLVFAVPTSGSLVNLYSANAGTAHTFVDTEGGTDWLLVLYNADPATNLGGVQVYFDEDGTATGRFLWVSPFNKDAYVTTGDGRMLKIADDDSAATNGVALYIDDDAATVDEKFLFISPTDTDGTDTTMTTLASVVGVGGADS